MLFLTAPAAETAFSAVATAHHLVRDTIRFRTVDDQRTACLFTCPVVVERTLRRDVECSARNDQISVGMLTLLSSATATVVFVTSEPVPVPNIPAITVQPAAAEIVKATAIAAIVFLNPEFIILLCLLLSGNTFLLCL